VADGDVGGAVVVRRGRVALSQGVRQNGGAVVTVVGVDSGLSCSADSARWIRDEAQKQGDKSDQEGTK
jgi:hypothetical protein